MNIVEIEERYFDIMEKKILKEDEQVKIDPIIS